MAKNNLLTPSLPFKFSEKTSADPIQIYTDGASRGNPGLAGIGVVITLGNGAPIEAKKFIGRTTNNTAEYQALLHGLKILKERNLLSPLKIYSDSQLMVRQLNRQYRIKQPHLRALAENVWKLLQFFPFYEIIHIPRGQNKRADKLANEAIDEREDR